MNAKDLERVLVKYGVRYNIGQKNYSICCPLAKWEHPSGHDSRPSMGVSINPKDVSLVNCFTCHFSGTLEDLLVKHDMLRGGGLDKLIEMVHAIEERDLVAVLDEYQDTLFPELVAEQVKIDSIKASSNGYAYDVVWDDKQLEYFRGIPKYAAKRGFTDEVSTFWEFGIDRKRKRLVVPVRNQKRELVGVMGRAAVDGVSPKWYAYWNFSKGDYLFGEHNVDVAKDVLILTEGMFDAIRLHSYGLPNPVCIFGSQLTRNQANKILDFGMPVVLAFDGDAGGRLATKRAIKLLNDRVLVTIMDIPEDSDPDNLTKDEALELFSARHLVGFKNILK